MTIERILQAAGDGPILIALSGGGDSVALLHMLAERVGAERLRAVVVDHALREGSAADAARAAGFARALGVGVEVRTLSWAGANAGAGAAFDTSLRDGSGRRSSRLPQAETSASLSRAQRESKGAPRFTQEAARRKRYAALCEAARAHGASIVAVAHTADDQAETVFMRAAKGSGWRGLAGMAQIAPAPVWPEGRGVLLARPLLGERRAALRDLLRARRAEWIEDPANANPVFERVRVRRRLAELERDGVDPMCLVRFAAEMRVLADAVDAEASALIARAARFEGPEITIDHAVWDAPPETRRRALSALIAAAAGAEREPASAAVARLEARIAEPSFRGASLGGARLRRRKDAVHVSRDPGAVAGREGVAPLGDLALHVGQRVVWDGRLAVEAVQALRLIPSPDAPRIDLDGKDLSLAEALADGVIGARWLTELHVNHQLGPVAATKSGF